MLTTRGNNMTKKQAFQTAVYSGSFDPITLGHVDLIERGAKMFDTLHIVVSINLKKQTFFTTEERVSILEKVTSHLDNVKVTSSDKLIVESCKELGANVILRGLRAVSDYEYELQMASMNNSMNKNIDTIFLPSKTEYSFLSSSLIKELASFKADTTQYVPEIVAQKLKEKFE